MLDADLFFEVAGVLESPSSGAELVAARANFDHEAVSLWKTGSGHIASFGVSRRTTVALGSLPVRYPFIDSLPDDRIFVCEPRSAGGTPNAWVFSASGSMEAEGHVGDGIEHVATTPSGAIWVGYFDEGVFGARDHSQHGIVRFTDSLEAEWVYPNSSPNHVISDCYTLNVDGETAVSCFFTDFPIVQIVGDTISSWTGAPPGPHGLLRSGDSVLLFGGYSEHRDRVVRLRLLADGSTEEVGVGRVIGLPDEQLTARICRGPEAHVFIGPAWYRASM